MTEKGQDAGTLRQRAEKIARQEAIPKQNGSEILSLDEARFVVHELQVHQIELEMQNEELRRAQEILSTTRDLYFNLYDLAPVGYFTLGSKGVIVASNLTFATMLGVARSALIKQPLSKYIRREDQDVFYHFNKRLVKTGKPQTCELRLLKQEDTDTWVQLNASLGKGPDGVDSILVVVTDIALRDKRILIVDDDAASAALMKKWLGDHQCAIAKDGLEALAQIELFKPDLVFLDVMLPHMDGFEVCQRIKKNPLSSNIPVVMVTALADRDSKLRGLEFGADEFLSKPIDPAELKIRTASLLKMRECANLLERHNQTLLVDLQSTNKILEAEIVEHRITENELEIFHRFFMFGRDIMLVIDGNEGRIINVNPAAEAAYGYTCEEFFGKHIFDLRIEAPEQQVRAQMLHALFEGITFETLHRRRDGSHFPVEVNSRGKLIGDRQILFSVVRDISDRRQSEEENFKTQQRIAQMEKMVSLGTLAAGVAHEIKQPLNALKLTADGIVYWNDKGKKAEWDKVIEALKTISAHSGRIDAIVKRLQGFVTRSKTNNDKAADVNEIVSAALDMVASNSRMHNVIVTRGICQESLPIWGDAGRLEEVVINIVVNAIQALTAANQPDKRVSVTTSREEASIVVDICNNGPCIPEDKIATIFEPFYSTKTTGDNMGLGLAIVKSIVEVHKGTIQVCNLTPGVSFRIELPVFNG